jgi:hypothetical protein
MKKLALALSALVITLSAQSQDMNGRNIENPKWDLNHYQAKKTVNDKVDDVSSRMGIALPEEMLFLVKGYFSIVQDMPKLKRLLDSYTNYEIIINKDFEAKLYLNNVGSLGRFQDYGIYLRIKLN